MTNHQQKNDLLILGLGNPILGDDGVGWQIVRDVENILKTSLNYGGNIELAYLSVGGLSLMEAMVGFKGVIVVDSIRTGTKPNGSVYSLPLRKIPNLSSGHTTSSHDTSLATALEMGKKLGFTLPEEVWVVAVEAEHVYEFSEKLSPAIEDAVPAAVNELLKILKIYFQENRISQGTEM